MVSYRPSCLQQHSNAYRCLKSSYLSHLRFPTTYRYANTQRKIQQVLQELADERENHGLKMNKSKTHVMMENDTRIYTNNIPIENIDSYVYLGQRYSIRDKNQDKEIQRRITAGWTAFAKPRVFFKDNIKTCLKQQVYANFQQ